MSLRLSLARVAGAVSAIVVIVSAPIGLQSYADNRYGNKDEIKQQLFAVKESIAGLHRARLEDEIFKLELIPNNKRTPADNAMLDRYKRQLREIHGKKDEE